MPPEARGAMRSVQTTSEGAARSASRRERRWRPHRFTLALLGLPALWAASTLVHVVEIENDTGADLHDVRLTAWGREIFAGSIAARRSMKTLFLRGGRRDGEMVIYRAGVAVGHCGYLSDAPTKHLVRWTPAGARECTGGFRFVGWPW